MEMDFLWKILLHYHRKTIIVKYLSTIYPYVYSLSHCKTNIPKKKIYKYYDNIPLGRTLFFLVHVIFGLGLPDAEHSIRTEAPFFTCITLPELMWWILGGTIKEKEKKIWIWSYHKVVMNIKQRYKKI